MTEPLIRSSTIPLPAWMAEDWDALQRYRISGDPGEFRPKPDWWPAKRDWIEARIASGMVFERARALRIIAVAHGCGLWVHPQDRHPTPQIKGRPIDMGGPRDQWIDDELWNLA